MKTIKLHWRYTLNFPYQEFTVVVSHIAAYDDQRLWIGGHNPVLVQESAAKIEELIKATT